MRTDTSNINQLIDGMTSIDGNRGEGRCVMVIEGKAGVCRYYGEGHLPQCTIAAH